MVYQVIRKKKQRNLQNAIEYAAKIFQKYRVLQDCLHTTGTKDMCRCFTCNALVPRNKNLHGGHWKKRSNHSVLFEKANCNAQCRTCNIDQHGNMNVYEQKMIEKYGQAERDRIIILAKQVKIWTFEELDGMVENWRAQIKRMEAQKI